MTVSDLSCEKLPAPRQVAEVFLKKRKNLRVLIICGKWYKDRGARILQEEECSRVSWPGYYDLTRERLLALAKKYRTDKEREVEIEEGFRERRACWPMRREYIGYMTFVIQKSLSNPSLIGIIHLRFEP